MIPASGLFRRALCNGLPARLLSSAAFFLIQLCHRPFRGKGNNSCCPQLHRLLNDPVPSCPLSGVPGNRTIRDGSSVSCSGMPSMLQLCSPASVYPVDRTEIGLPGSVAHCSLFLPASSEAHSSYVHSRILQLNFPVSDHPGRVCKKLLHQSFLAVTQTHSP